MLFSVCRFSELLFDSWPKRLLLQKMRQEFTYSSLHMSVLFLDSVGQLPYRSKNFDKTFKSFLKDVTLKFEMSFILMKFLSSNTFLLKKKFNQWRKIWNFFQHSSILSFSEVHIFFVMVYAKNSKNLTKTFETVTMSKYRYIMYYAAPISENKRVW